MDLHTIDRFLPARTRADLDVLADDCAVVAGGTWMFGQPQPHLRALVDLTTMGWPDLTVSADGLEIAATCTISALRGFPPQAPWPALKIVEPCASAFASSPKIWDLATIGGNVCLALPAGPMISLLVSLDATAQIWCPGGTTRSLAVVELVTGPCRTSLATGEVIRSFQVPAGAMRAEVVLRRISLAVQGRSGAIVIARLDQDGSAVVTVTAATGRPHRLAFARLPTAEELAAELDGLTDWYDDHHGSPAWRRAMVLRLGFEAVAELAAR